ncbi:MAG: DUF2127 domain-containing protein [Acidobacteriaceae bacterium]|nr:DUF2127 domain-containing protein [Acidobacteriaceae bacterium]
MSSPEVHPALPHPHAPQAVDERSSPAGLRAVATFEALKGAAVISIGIFLLFTHQRAEDFAASLLYHLHIEPDRRLSHMLMDAAWKVSDARLWTIAAAALTYASVRFVEAWGLWNRRIWAEWFALLSGTLYLPWEILKLVERIDWERLSVLSINLLIVGYMLYIRIRDCGSVLNCTEETTPGP